MATRRLILEPGIWWGGYHAPFFVSTGMVESFLRKQGFDGFKWQDRGDPLPAAINPKADPRYTDDWDSWVSAHYAGERRTVELPHYEYVDWILVQAQAQPTAPPKPPAKAPVNWSEVFIVGGLLWWFSKRKGK